MLEKIFNRGFASKTTLFNDSLKAFFFDFHSKEFNHCIFSSLLKMH
jgi:hypothetical protein